MNKRRLQVIFHGQVQGVGFRYTAKYIASNYGLTGWIQNEYDGSVMAQVQGTPAAIQAWLEQLNGDRYIRIEWMEKEDMPVDEDERHFRIRGW